MSGRIEDIRHGSGAVLLALEWGPPSGVVALHWFAGLATQRPVAQIDLLLVGTAERRRGIGRLLVKAAAQAARVAGCGSLTLAGAVEDELHAFCLSTGFIQTGLRFDRALRRGDAG